jgi:hypothetical protein
VKGTLHSKVSAVALAFVMLFGFIVAKQDPSDSAVQTGGTPSHSEVQINSTSKPALQVSDFEQQKFAFEKNIEEQKLEIERDKLTIERSRIRWTALATVAPFLGVLLTIGFSMWSLTKQFRQQSQQQEKDAQLQFELKAAEILFAGKTPLAVQNRGKAMKALFGERLRNNFADAYDPSEISERIHDPEPKRFFLELLLKHPDKQIQIIQLWKDLFPGDVDWLVKVNLPGDVTRI